MILSRKPSRGKPVNVSECLRLYRLGLSMNEVGRQLGHHHSVIKYHLIRNDIPIKPQSVSQRKSISSDKIKEMYLSGMSASEIGKDLNITYQCVYDRLAEIGVKTRNRREQIKMMIERGTYNVSKGENHKNWNGGTTIDRWGYRKVNINGKYILEHRYVWEDINGELQKNWIVHHLNGNKLDNRIENLVAMPRKHHSPKKIIEPFKRRINGLEAQVKRLELQYQLLSLKKRV